MEASNALDTLSEKELGERKARDRLDRSCRRQDRRGNCKHQHKTRAMGEGSGHSFTGRI